MTDLSFFVAATWTRPSRDRRCSKRTEDIPASLIKGPLFTSSASGKPHISNLPTRNVNLTFGCVCSCGGRTGGGLAGVTFLCDTLWENSIFLLKNFLTFWNNLGKGYKITFVSNSSSSSFSFFTKFILLI